MQSKRVVGNRPPTRSRAGSLFIKKYTASAHTSSSSNMHRCFTTCGSPINSQMRYHLAPLSRSSTRQNLSSQTVASFSTGMEGSKRQKADNKDPRKQNFWTERDMPSQDGKTFVITGATSGMGYTCAENIAKKGGHVILTGRSLERCNKATKMIKDAGARGKVEPMHLDLTSFQSIVDFTNDFREKNLPLHVLVENAGVFLVPHDHTEEGFETTVGTNYFGHFLLTHMLLDPLKKTAEQEGSSRIVAMSSLFEQLGRVHFDDLEGYRTRESGLLEYSNSKLMVIMAAREINKRLKGSGVECFISQPGLVATPLNGRKLDHQKLTSNLVDIATKVYGQSPARGSLCLQRPATDPSITGYGGSYFSPPWIGLLALQLDNAGMREPSNSLARDEVAWVHLYRQTLQIVNRKLEERGLSKINSI